MNLGEKLLKLRKKKGLSQEEVAEKLGVTRQTISNWETGQTAPDLEQASTLSHFYQVSLDELVGSDVQNIVVEKVSNVEKLAGMIIRVLKIFGILLIVYIVVMFLGLTLFIAVKKSPKESVSVTNELTCKLEEKDYIISWGSDGFFNCSNCEEERYHDIKESIDFADIKGSEPNVRKYFEDLGGSCE